MEKNKGNILRPQIYINGKNDEDCYKNNEISLRLRWEVSQKDI